MPNESEPKGAYAELGVSADKGGVKRAIQGLSKGLFPNAFCKVLPDLLGGDEAYAHIGHADTTGTKGSVGYMRARETGDLRHIRKIPIDSIMMNLGDLACIGAVGEEPIVIKNIVNRNPLVFNDDYLAELIAGDAEYLEHLRSLGINIHSAGGETADVGDVVGSIDVGHVADVRMRRDKIIDMNIQAGDAIVGLASSGQATYEQEYNSGLGSNGYTLARHGMLAKEYAEKYPETVNRYVPQEKVYRGPFRLGNHADGLPVGITIGDALTSPTRNYLPVLRRVLQNRDGIHGIIHNTGGAQTKVEKFLPPGLQAVKDKLMVVPPIFRLIQKTSGTSWEEMFKVFNCGHMMELYVDPSRVDDIIRAADAFGIQAQKIGDVRKGDVEKVRIESVYGTFKYPPTKAA